MLTFKTAQDSRRKTVLLLDENCVLNEITRCSIIIYMYIFSVFDSVMYMYMNSIARIRVVSCLI